MSFLFIYILKLSVSLAVVFLFYHFVLRKLTFYNWNRWYLLGYTLLSFVIPFINITPALDKNELTDITVVQWVPVLYKTADNSFTPGNILLLLIITGMLVLLIRLLIQFISFRQMKKRATGLERTMMVMIMRTLTTMMTTSMHQTTSKLMTSLLIIPRTVIA